METFAVKKAVIPAAGLNIRVLPFSKAIPKTMLPVLNKPTIHYVVEECIAAGICEVAIVVSEPDSPVIKYFAADRKLENQLEQMGNSKALEELEEIRKKTKLRFFVQKKPDGWLAALLCAKNFIGKKPFAVLLGDLLFEKKYNGLADMIASFQKSGKNVWGNGRYVLKPQVLEIIQKKRLLQNDEESVQELANCLGQNSDLEIVPMQATLYTVGDILNYVKTVSVFALEDAGIGNEYRRFLLDILKKG